MDEAVKTLRKYFKSPEWNNACKDLLQPTVSDKGIIDGLDTKINLALDFEGRFNDFAREYMQYRKDNNLKDN